MTRPLYDVADARGTRPLVNGRPLPDGVTLDDWMRLHFAHGFYGWLNALRGCDRAASWRLDGERGWCGV
jgi:hypothetical protein